jgi:HAD superfamily hydrolase (TIGR01509 family)
VPKLPIVFLDDGGVMSDNAMRPGPWQRLVGEFFVPRLGGSHWVWAEANRRVTATLFADFDAVLNEDRDFASFERRYNRLWLPPMCRWVGVAEPPDDEIDALCREATAWITRRVEAPQRGAPEAVRWLSEHDYRLFTASGEDSIALDGYLSAIGVREYFGERVYGPDLLGVMKSGPWFYESLFAETGVDPADALVIDDSPKAIAWARGVGAEALHVGTELSRLADLPEWLSRRGE